MPQVLVDREVEHLSSRPGGGEPRSRRLLGHATLAGTGSPAHRCITGPWSCHLPAQRLAAAIDAPWPRPACQATPALLRESATSPVPAAMPRCQRLLVLRHTPDSAVFACNDLMAIGAICAAAARGLRIPEGSVGGWLRRYRARPAYSNPPLTTVVQPEAPDWARWPHSLLLERIDRSGPCRCNARSCNPSCCLRQADCAGSREAARMTARCQNRSSSSAVSTWT